MSGPCVSRTPCLVHEDQEPWAIHGLAWSEKFCLNEGDDSEGQGQR